MISITPLIQLLESLLLIIRDYSYLTWRRAHHDHDDALKQGKQLTIALLTVIWSLPILALVAITINRLGYGSYVRYHRPNNIFSIVSLGLLMFTPFALLAWRWLGKLKDVPINQETPYQKLAIKTWSIVFISFAMTIIIPLIVQRFA